MSVGIVAVSDVRGGNKERERVLVLRIQEASLSHLLNLLHALLLVAAQNDFEELLVWEEQYILRRVTPAAAQ